MAQMGFAYSYAWNDKKRLLYWERYRRLKMFLREMRVKNFRGIKDISIGLDDNTVLIGENNVGKTTFLEAIKKVLSRQASNIRFEEYDYHLEDDTKSPQEASPISIEFVFSEVDEDGWGEDFIGRFSDIIQPQIDNATGKILNFIYLRITSSFNESTKEFESLYSFCNTNGEPLDQKTNRYIKDILKLNPAFYLQALREIGDTFSGRSQFWGRFLKQAKPSKEQIETIRADINALNNTIIESDKSLSQLVESLNGIKDVLDYGNDTISINALPLKTWELLSKAQVTLKTDASHVNLPIEKHGQGAQSISTILLYEAYINILLKEIYGSGSNAILTLEEPEAHLHPQAIRALEKHIRKINCQKIITTHSPYFLQNLDIYDIRIFKKNKSNVEVFQINKTVSLKLDQAPERLGQIAGNFTRVMEFRNSFLIVRSPIQKPVEKSLIGLFKEHSQIDEIKALIADSQKLFSEDEKIQLNMFVQQTRGELFFAKAWLLAEGESESILLPYFAEVLNLDLDANGVSFIDYRSNGSAGAFVKLAEVLGFRWRLLADKDEQGNRSYKELEKMGIDQKRIDNLTKRTQERDIEHDLAKLGFLEDFEIILGDKIEADVKAEKEKNSEGYKDKIVALIQVEKVKNTQKLVVRLKERKMQPDEIPPYIQKLIEGVVKG